MDMKALFRVQCGLYVAAAELDGKFNGCITNTLMQHSHVPVRLSLTLEKSHLTHDMLMGKRSVGVSALSLQDPVPLIRRFGFASGRERDKFADFPFSPDVNGNPLLGGGEIAATFSLRVYDTVDIETHTLFLCTVTDMQALGGEPITYEQYRALIRK